MTDHARKFAPKRYTHPSLLACLCLKEYLHLDCRGAEALLASTQALRAAIVLRAVPDHSTLWWFQRYKVTPRLLARLLTETLRPFRRRGSSRTHTVAVDSTDFARDQASPYYRQRAGKRHRACCLDRSPSTVWTDYNQGPRGNHVEFRPLIEQSLARLPLTRLLADDSYASEANHRWLRADLGIESIIPPVTGRPLRGVTPRPYRRQRQLAFPRKVYSYLGR